MIPKSYPMNKKDAMKKIHAFRRQGIRYQLIGTPTGYDIKQVI